MIPLVGVKMQKGLPLATLSFYLFLYQKLRLGFTIQLSHFGIQLRQFVFHQIMAVL